MSQCGSAPPCAATSCLINVASLHRIACGDVYVELNLWCRVCCRRRRAYAPGVCMTAAAATDVHRQRSVSGTCDRCKMSGDRQQTPGSLIPLLKMACCKL